MGPYIKIRGPRFCRWSLPAETPATVDATEDRVSIPYSKDDWTRNQHWQNQESSHQHTARWSNHTTRQNIEGVDHFTYIGIIVNTRGGADGRHACDGGKGWLHLRKGIRHLKTLVWRNRNISLRTKLRIFVCVILWVWDLEQTKKNIHYL